MWENSKVSIFWHGVYVLRLNIVQSSTVRRRKFDGNYAIRTLYAMISSHFHEHQYIELRIQHMPIYIQTLTFIHNTYTHTHTKAKNVSSSECHEQKTTKNHDQFSFDKQRVWKRISLHRWTKWCVRCLSHSEITTHIFCSFFNRKRFLRKSIEILSLVFFLVLLRKKNHY